MTWSQGIGAALLIAFAVLVLIAQHRDRHSNNPK